MGLKGMNLIRFVCSEQDGFAAPEDGSPANGEEVELEEY